MNNAEEFMRMSNEQGSVVHTNYLVESSDTKFIFELKNLASILNTLLDECGNPSVRVNAIAKKLNININNKKFFNCFIHDISDKMVDRGYLSFKTYNKVMHLFIKEMLRVVAPHTKVYFISANKTNRWNLTNDIDSHWFLKRDYVKNMSTNEIRYFSTKKDVEDWANTQSSIDTEKLLTDGKYRNYELTTTHTLDVTTDPFSTKWATSRMWENTI